MINDTSAHHAPQSILEVFAAGTEPFSNVEVLHEGDTWKIGFAGGPLNRPINQKIRHSETCSA